MTDITFDPSIYQPPNVYIQREERPSVTTASRSPSIPCLVGPARPFRTKTDVVVLNNEDPVQLSKLGIDEASVVVRDSAGATVAGTEYVLVVGGGEDGDAGTTGDNTLTIARTAASAIDNGSAVTVTYNFTDDAFFLPVVYSQMDAVIDHFGQPMTATGEVDSPLSLAAQQAFRGGASEVMLVATPVPQGAAPAGWGGTYFTTDADISTALQAVEALENANVIVPLPVSIEDVATTASNVKAHVETASAAGFFRTALVSGEHWHDNATNPPDTLASSLASKRTGLVWPYSYSYYASRLDRTLKVGGYYAAAFLAGRLAARLPQYGLTRQRVRGFAGITPTVQSTMTNNLMNGYTSSGVMVLSQSTDGSIHVRHGVSSDVSTVLNAELSITRQEDLLIGSIRNTLQNSGMIGGPIGPTTLIQIKGTVFGLLQSYVDQGVITGFIDLGTRQNPDNPSVVEVKFRWRPSYPLNYIVLRFAIDTTTGQAVNQLAA